MASACSALSYPMGKGAEACKLARSLVVCEKGVHTMCLAEVLPSLPIALVNLGSFIQDPSSGGLGCIVEHTREISLSGGWSISHEEFCVRGKRELNSVRKVLSSQLKFPGSPVSTKERLSRSAMSLVFPAMWKGVSGEAWVMQTRMASACAKFWPTRECLLIMRVAQLTADVLSHQMATC